MNCDASAGSETGTAAARKRLSRMDAKTPTIARLARPHHRAKADEYAKYLYDRHQAARAEGARGSAVTRGSETETEFITISYWENVEAMSRFTGADPRQIHHLPRDKEFLIDLPNGVQVLTISSSRNLFSKSG